MSAEIPDPGASQTRSNRVAIAAIIAATIIILACIAACAVTAVAFLRWAPWG